MPLQLQNCSTPHDGPQQLLETLLDNAQHPERLLAARVASIQRRLALEARTAPALKTTKASSLPPQSSPHLLPVDKGDKKSRRLEVELWPEVGVHLQTPSKGALPNAKRACTTAAPPRPG
jgi:hypothetical protein